MKFLLKTEELGICLLSLYGISKLTISLPWWLYVLLFFSPDIGMLGYLINTKAGAFFYNLFHHKLIAVACLALGWLNNNQYIMLAGLILIAHSSFDRLFGYGLKYNDSFKHTHLGTLK